MYLCVTVIRVFLCIQVQEMGRSRGEGVQQDSEGEVCLGY